MDLGLCLESILSSTAHQSRCLHSSVCICLPNTNTSASQFLMMGLRPIASTLVEEEKKMEGCFSLLACLLTCFRICWMAGCCQGQVAHSVSGRFSQLSVNGTILCPISSSLFSCPISTIHQTLMDVAFFIYEKGRVQPSLFHQANLKPSAPLTVLLTITQEIGYPTPQNQGKILVPLLKSEYSLSVHSIYLGIRTYIYISVYILSLVFSLDKHIYHIPISQVSTHLLCVRHK